MIKLESLNKEQQLGVTTTEGPVLILAGAGSGKTRVLTNRVAYLIDECNVSPYDILAITFTNKAAGEMRQRIMDQVGYGADIIWISTFHSCCVRILRRFADRAGYGTDFTIYDSDDQKTLMKEICKRLEIDTKRFKEKTFLSAISSAKNELIGPDAFRRQAEGDYIELMRAEVYDAYQKALVKNNAMDFDDLIMKTVELLQADNEVRDHYQERFKYIMVDEYQDTNTAQFMLIKILAGKYNNLCVVGDDDQSIYKFRGANIENILNFESLYPNAKVIKLEQNYRSTQNILSAANGVIANNKGRKAKALWSQEGDGIKPHIEQLETADEEAFYIANDIRHKVNEGAKYSDFAVLYRTNAQSRSLEERFVKGNIPYRLVGGVNFYSRKEVKDMLAYLKTVNSAKDDIAVSRILNIPKRGIGATSENRVRQYAYDNDISFYDALLKASDIPGMGKAAGKIDGFTSLIEDLKYILEQNGPARLLTEIIERTGYVEELELENTIESKTRIENIDELYSKLVEYCETNDDPNLDGFLEEVALIAEIDSLDPDSDYVVLMTLHGAKGLEFENVYMSGMEDGLFPSYMSITADDKTELEEERRLCYVGMTRAKRRLVLTSARARMLHGETQYNALSRFVHEIPSEYLDGYIKKNVADEAPKNETYRRAKEAFHEKPAFAKASFETMKTFGQVKNEGISIDYAEGDRVSHIKFGQGRVLKIVEGGRDYEVTVDFDSVGQKKMFAMFAKLKKI